jgi:hypothetical protein
MRGGNSNDRIAGVGGRRRNPKCALSPAISVLLFDAPHNIRVSVVSPGSIDTRRDHPERYHGRLPNAVTGQTIHVNGGAHYY